MRECIEVYGDVIQTCRSVHYIAGDMSAIEGVPVKQGSTVLLNYYGASPN